MRQGRIYRRCGKCTKPLPERVRSCPSCGYEKSSWVAIVDINLPGMPRQQRSKACKTKAEAVEWVAVIQAGKKAGTWVEPAKLTLGAYLDDWLQRTADLAGWEANTRQDYAGSIARFIKPSPLGDTPLQSLTADHVKSLYAFLLRKGRVLRDGTRGPLSRKTVHNVHICLRSALQDALEQDPPIIRRNPASKAFAYSRRKHRVEMHTWSTEQATLFLDFTAQDPDATLYRVALMTGARRGELLGLRHQDLDLDRARISIRQQYTRDGANGLGFKGLKNDASAWRTIDLDAVTVDALRVRLEVQAFERRRTDYQDGDLVFCEPDGTPYDPDSMTRRFGRRAAQAGLPHLRFHDLRHTHATWLLEGGEPLKYVAERLGDRADTVLETYSHVTSKMRTAAVTRLAALLDAPPHDGQLVVVDGDR